MLRWWLLGGRWPPLPWELFITLGAAVLAAGGLFAFLFPLWGAYPWVGFIEVGIFGVAGCTLIGFGAVRRSRGVPAESTPVE